MTSYKTAAIIIGRLSLGESDRILTLFSPEFGIIKAIAKGSRKPKSKFSGHTELFTLGDFVITHGKSLDIVTDVSLIENYMSSTSNIENVKSAYYFAEIITKLLPIEEPHPEVFELLQFCLRHYEKTGDNLCRLIFIAKILKFLGIYPELSSCVKCSGKPSNGDIYFSKSGGGIIDKTCSLHFVDATLTNEDVIKLWRFVTNNDFSKIARLNIQPLIIQQAAEIAIGYIACATMIDYRSLRVLN